MSPLQLEVKLLDGTVVVVLVAARALISDACLDVRRKLGLQVHARTCSHMRCAPVDECDDHSHVFLCARAVQCDSDFSIYFCDAAGNYRLLPDSLKVR